MTPSEEVSDSLDRLARAIAGEEYATPLCDALADFVPEAENLSESLAQIADGVQRIAAVLERIWPAPSSEAAE